MEDVLKAVKLIRKAARLNAAANKAKEPEKAADLRFQAWVASRQAAELIRKS